MTDNEKALELQALASKGNIKARQELWMLLLDWASKQLKAWCKKLRVHLTEEELYDMSNDTVAKAMEKIDSGDLIGNFSGFLYHTTSNALRSRKTHLMREDMFTDLDALIESGRA